MSLWESSSRRRNVQSSSSRLRMDAYRSASRLSRNRASSPKRRELDKVMKKARRDGPTQSNYWNKKLLEAEEKDPNRWRHSGFKELYGGGGNSSPHGSHSSRKRSRSRSREAMRSSRNRVRSPPVPARPRSRSRDRNRERDRDRDRSRRPHTPQPQTQRPQTQQPRRRTPKMASLTPSSRSLSSCSDESCSVCSPKGNRKVVTSPAPVASRARQPTPRSRSRSFSVPRNRPNNRSPVPPRSGLRRQRERSGPPSDPRGPPPSPPPAARKSVKSKRKSSRDKKRHNTGRPEATDDGDKLRNCSIEEKGYEASKGSTSRRRSSPPPSCSDESSTSSVTSGGGAPKLTLSERFGKMAQWSVDRRDLDGVKNMRITKDSDSSDLKVVIEGERYHRALSPLSVSERRVGAGYFPDSMHSGIGLEAWDDVRVRYKYYKDRGYLRDLTLDDYMKWEEWWYKYQEWLETERYYEHWAAIRAKQAARGGSKMWNDQSLRKRRR
ncbi:hypothetical protein L9F63_001554, partial [Diploptera punctata]